MHCKLFVSSAAMCFFHVPCFESVEMQWNTSFFYFRSSIAHTKKGTRTCFMLLLLYLRIDSIQLFFTGLLININKAQRIKLFCLFHFCWVGMCWCVFALQINFRLQLVVVESGKEMKLPSGLVNTSEALRSFNGLDEFIFQLLIAFVRWQIEPIETVKEKKKLG